MTTVPQSPDFAAGPRWRYRAALGSVLLAAVSYLGFVLWAGWQDVANAVARVGSIGVGIALSLSLVNYGLRFIRWQWYLQTLGYPVPWWPSLKIYLAGFALTTTPGKAGEALRGVFLRRWGMPYVKSLAAFLSERVSDLVAVVALTLFGLTLYPAAQPLIALGIAGVIGIFLVLSNQAVLERCLKGLRSASRLASLLRTVLEILLNARCCHTPLLLTGATLLSLVAWSAEAWAFYLLLQWMGLETSLTFAVFVYALSMLAGALSFMPGGLGGAEAVMVTLLLWAGIGSADAIAATVLIRVTTLWFAVALGAIGLAHAASKMAPPPQK